MSGEDVYDLAGVAWCDLCEAPHLPCNEPDDDELEAEIDILDHQIEDGTFDDD